MCPVFEPLTQIIMESLLLFDRTVLKKSRTLFAQGQEPAVSAAKAEVLKLGEVSLEKGRYSVTFKQHIPPSGDKKDFSTLSRYWWPDPAKNDGLPYILRDGITNPKFFEYDRIPLGHFCNAFFDSVTAWYFNGDVRCGQQAAGLLETWFLDEHLGMNPNMNFAGFIPGLNHGRGNGIISTLKFTRILDWITLLFEGGLITKERYEGFRRWFGHYRDWLLHSEIAQQEFAATNNHGAWYDCQVIAYSLFAGDRQTAKNHLQSVSFDRFASQVAEDGSMPEELRRTKSLGYSEYCLHAWLDVCTMGKLVDEDLLNYGASNNRPLMQKITDYLLPYFTNEKPWQYEQIEFFPVEKTLPHILRLARLYRNSAYEEAARKIAAIGLPSGKTFFWYGCGDAI